MSLKIRCSSCGRGTHGNHSQCSNCRGPSVEKIVYVGESGDRIEVTTIERPPKSSSSRSKRRESRASRAPAGRHAEPSYATFDAAYHSSSAEAYRDAGRYLGRDGRDVEWDVANGYPYAYGGHAQPGCEMPGVAYVRPRVHPYGDRYEYIDANVRYVHPPQAGGYPANTPMYHAPPPHGGHWQPPAGAYHPQASYDPEQQASGQRTQVNYVYSGTEGPDGEQID